MERRFVVKSTLEKECCLALARHQMTRQRVVFGILDVLLAACMLFLWRFSGEVPNPFLLLFFALLVIYTLFLDRIVGWLMYRSTNREIGQSEYAFDEGGLTVTNAVENTRLSYTAFMKIDESDRHFFLYLQKSSALVLPKAAFVEGDPAAFAAFLTEKCAKPVRAGRN